MTRPGFRSLENESQSGLFDLGGLALFNGVMICSKAGVGWAIRLADGTVLLRQFPHAKHSAVYRFLRILPVLRGILGLLEMSRHSFRALMFSAWVAEANPDPRSLRTAQLPESLGRELNRLGAVSLALIIGFFLAFQIIGFGAASEAGWLMLTLTALLSVAVQFGAVVVYAFAIGQFGEIKRVYQYHSAEHLAVWNYESNANLSIGRASQFPVRHPRCGTILITFLLVVQAVLQLLLSLMTPPLWLDLLMLPLIIAISVGLGYELFRLADTFRETRFVKVCVRPGFILQRITTRAPSEEQIEVGLLALQTALAISPGQAYEKGWVVQGLQIGS